MNITVVGAEGMLGRAVADEATNAGHAVSRIGHDSFDIADGHPWSRGTVDVAINCAGMRPGTGEWGSEMIRTNALGPHRLAEDLGLVGIKLIHVSTDCVFNGSRSDWSGGYEVERAADAIDLYGRSKSAGELIGVEGCRTIRTSFIGPNHGLLGWLLTEARKGTPEVRGYWASLWGGSTVWEVARGIVKEAEWFAKDHAARHVINGIVHLATEEPQRKYDVVAALVDALDLPLRVRAVPEPKINRALEPTEGRVLRPVIGILPELVERVRAYDGKSRP